MKAARPLGVLGWPLAFLRRLARGEPGLGRMFWLYGVGGSLTYHALLRVVAPDLGALVVLILAFPLYEVPVLIGIWRAAGRYAGSPIWADLARWGVVLWWTSLVLTTAGFLWLLGMLLLAPGVPADPAGPAIVT